MDKSALTFGIIILGIFFTIAVGLSMSYITSLDLDGDMEKYLAKPGYNQAQPIFFFGLVSAPVIMFLCMLGVFQHYSKNKSGVSITTANIICAGGWVGTGLVLYGNYSGF